jgi:hypothetical protein
MYKIKKFDGVPISEREMKLMFKLSNFGYHGRYYMNPNEVIEYQMQIWKEQAK